MRHEANAYSRLVVIFLISFYWVPAIHAEEGQRLYLGKNSDDAALEAAIKALSGDFNSKLGVESRRTAGNKILVSPPPPSIVDPLPPRRIGEIDDSYLPGRFGPYSGLGAGGLPGFSILNRTPEEQAQFDLDYGQVYGYDSDGKKAYNPFTDANGPSIEKLIQAAQDPKNKIQTADDFLAYLKKNHLDFFNKPAWVYDSESSQQDAVNREYRKDPNQKQQFRALSIGGRVLMGIVMDPKHPKYHQVELAEALPQGGYLYKRMTFPGKGSPVSHLTVEGQEACVRCHGDPPRPIWKTYPLWPGLVGGNHDERDSYQLGSAHKLPEAEHFETLRQRLGQGGRYGLFRPARQFDLDYFSTNNIGFTARIAGLNFHQMMKSLENSKAMYKKYKYAIYAALKNCPDIRGFLPDAIQRQHDQRLGKTIEQLTSETRELEKAQYQARRLRYLQLNHVELAEADRTKFLDDTFDEEDAAKVATLRYLLDGQSVDPRFDMRQWSLNFGPGRHTYSYSFTTPAEGINDFFRKGFWQSARFDKDFQMPESCSSLQTKSLAALKPKSDGTAHTHDTLLAGREKKTH